MTELRISPDLALPVDAATETFGILAKKGAGKSNAAVVMAEEMWDAGVPWVAIDPKGDWWGVRSSSDGKNPGLALPVFGGRHGDVPLEPTAGPMLADLILSQRLTCVLDVSEFTKADVTRFLLAFADRLYRQAEDEPLHLFLEEAHEYLPQRVMRDEGRLVGAWQKIVKQGRFKGIGCTLVSQRSASLNKDVLTQVDTLIVLRTTSPQDRAAVKAWVDVNTDHVEMLDTLPSLADGEAWVWSPEFLHTLSRIKFRRRRTFDSGATPKVGHARRTPSTLADVDLGAIKDQMAETIERAKADDPKELRKRIKVLERQLDERPAETVVETVVEQVEVPVVGDTVIGKLAALDSLARDVADLRTDLAAIIAKWGDRDRQDVPRARPAGDGARPVADRGRPDRTPERADPPARRDAGSPPVPRPAAVDGDVKLGPGEIKILTAIAQHADGVTVEQLSVLTSYKRSSRNTYVQRLKQHGLVVAKGNRLHASGEGLDVLGDDFEPLPTGEALRDYWMGELPEGERRILGELVAAWPNGVVFEQLDDTTGYKRSSRNTYLQRLRARQLVTTTSGEAWASDLLFDEAGGP